MHAETSDQIVYMSLEDYPTNRAKIWVMNESTPNVAWKGFSNSDPSYTVLGITTNKIFTITTDQTTRGLVMHVFDFPTNSFDWSKELACWTSSCSIQQTEVVYDSNNNQIIAFNVYNNVGLMYFLNATDGSLTKDKYIFSEQMESVLAMMLYNNETLYISGYTQTTSLIITFNISDSTYTIYDVLDIYIYDILGLSSTERYSKIYKCYIDYYW